MDGAKNHTEYSSPRAGRSYVSVSENRPAMASFSDVILHKFFEAEKDTLDNRTIQEKSDQSHDEDFHKIYKLETEENELGTKRFSVNPLWKDPEPRPEYDPYENTKMVMTRHQGLERKLYFARNVKMKKAYQGGIKK